MSLMSIKIFVSSPGDVAQERFLTEKVLTRLQNVYRHVCKLEPIFWEHEPLTADKSFQEGLISPRETDIVICILWSRLGTRLPKNVTGGAHLTGTEFEFVEAVEGRKQKGVPDLLVYRKTAKPFADLSDKQRRTEALGQIEALEAFFDKWFTNEEGALVAAFHPFERADDFEEHVEHHLRKLIDSRLAAAGISPEDGIGPDADLAGGFPLPRFAALRLRARADLLRPHQGDRRSDRSPEAPSGSGPGVPPRARHERERQVFAHSGRRASGPVAARGDRRRRPLPAGRPSSRGRPRRRFRCPRRRLAP